MAVHTLTQIWFTSDGRKPSSGLWQRFRRLLRRRGNGFGGHVVNIRLRAGQHLLLRDAAGWTAVCRAGTLWITQEADARDIFLKADEGCALDRPGLALISAWRRDATMAIRPPAGGAGVHGLRDIHLRSGVPDDGADLAWLRALYAESGPWHDPASYRRAGLL